MLQATQWQVDHLPEANPVQKQAQLTTCHALHTHNQTSQPSLCVSHCVPGPCRFLHQPASARSAQPQR